MTRATATVEQISPNVTRNCLRMLKGFAKALGKEQFVLLMLGFSFQAVSEKGDTPFREARANCPAIKDAIMNPQSLGGTVDASTHPLDDATIKSMITNRLKDYIPMDLIGNYLGGTNGVVEEIEILEKSYEKEQLNAIGKAFFGEPKNYWGVVVRVKGDGQVGSNSMVAGMLSGDPDSKRKFNSKTKYRFYDAEDGSWSLVSPEELLR